MARQAVAFVAIGVIAVVFLLKTFDVLSHRGKAVRAPRKRPMEPGRAVGSPAAVTQVAICILSRRSAWKRRHVARQTWLQEDIEGAQISHIFVIGEDWSFTADENALLVAEVEMHRDILIAPEEEDAATLSALTKHCIYWVTKHHDFDLLIKVDDDSTLFLSRIVGSRGWLRDVAGRRDYVYFGRKHALAKVANPANLEAHESVKTDMLFEFDYRGVYWPEYMEGGMYGLSGRLVEDIVRNEFRTYTAEDAMVGVWVSAFPADVLYLADEQVLSPEAKYFPYNGSRVVVAFHTDLMRMVSLWCEFAAFGTVTPYEEVTKLAAKKTADCHEMYEGSSRPPRSLPLGAREKHEALTLAALRRERPVHERPNLVEASRWWKQMKGAYRGKSAAMVGTSTVVDRLPLYLFQGLNTLVFDDFFLMSERYTSWAPSMYMCLDPVMCASNEGVSAARRKAKRAGFVANVESANKFARSVAAVFYVASGGVGGVEYWRYLRQRVNAHWFEAGASGIAAEEVGAVRPLFASDTTPSNMRVVSQTSGIAMGVEILSFLGFSPIYVTAASEEIAAQWPEIGRALELSWSLYGTEIVYLHAGDKDRLPRDKVRSSGRGGGELISSQEDILEWAKTRNQSPGDRSARWDLDVFLHHFPVINRLEVVRDASSLAGIFPKCPRCRDADDLDRFQKAILCPVTISLKHFSSFLTWHIPYGPVRDMYVWAKR